MAMNQESMATGNKHELSKSCTIWLLEDDKTNSSGSGEFLSEEFNVETRV